MSLRLPHRLDLELLWRDVRYSLRAIRKTRSLSIAVVITLVVGVGMNAVVFSLFDALLFRPHVAKDPSSFVRIYASLSGQWYRELHGPRTQVTLEDYELIRSTTRTMSDVTVARWASFMLDAGEGESASLRGVFASCNYLSAHIARPMRLGRGFAARDCAAPGGEPVVILAESAWERYFANDPHIIGRTLRLNDRKLTVIGVAPDDATGDPLLAMVYVPFTMQPLLQGPIDYFREPPGRHAWLNMSGRLRPGRTRGDAQAELDVIAKRVDRLHPGQVTGMIVTDGSIIGEPETARRMPMLVVLCFSVTFLILLMVCANVTTLLLARAVARRHDVAIRVSLGAGRGRLMSQLLTETVLLGGVAAVISIALSFYAVPRIAQALTDFPLVLNSFAPDWRVFGFTFGLAFIAGCAAGMTPALEALRFSPSNALKSGGCRDTGTGTVSGGLRGTLIANQLAISLALLIAMGLVVRAEDRLLRVSLDYDADATLLTHIDLAQAGYNGYAARAFYDRLVPSLDALPGVTAVALSSPPPFAGVGRRTITIEGVAGPTTLTPVRAVSASYFPIVGLRLLKGRIFTEAESRTAVPVMPIVVSASFESTFFSGSEAIGRRIRFGNDDEARIVGVVNDTVSIRPSERDELMIYQPMYAANVASVTTVVRFDGDARPLMQAIRARVREIDSRLLATPDTVANTIAREADRYTVVAKTTALPAGIALFLSIVGVYGVAAFAAAHRSHEIGVRIAFGARTWDIASLFLHSLRRPFIVSVLGGCGLAAFGVLLLQRTRVMTGVSLVDPLTFVAAIILLLCTAAGATLIPAFRAARKDPWSTLRDS